MSFDSGIDFCTLFQVSSTRLIRYVNSSMVPDIDFGSIQNWMYEYLYIWCSLLKISLLPLTVALLHFLIISQCPRLIFFKFRTCSIVFKQVVFFLEECEYIHMLILRNCHQSCIFASHLYLEAIKQLQKQLTNCIYFSKIQ